MLFQTPTKQRAKRRRRLWRSTWTHRPKSVSAITAGEDKDYDSDASGGSEAPGITQEEEFWLSAVPKKTARQKVWEATGRKRKRGGQNVDYYNRWAYAPPEKRKHQPK